MGSSIASLSTCFATLSKSVIETALQLFWPVLIHEIEVIPLALLGLVQGPVDTADEPLDDNGIDRDVDIRDL